MSSNSSPLLRSCNTSRGACGGLILAVQIMSSGFAWADQSSDSSTASVAAQTGSPSSQATAQLEEVVVTAQKREEVLRNVPISIAVISGQDLDKSTALGVEEILNRVPAVSTLSSYQGGGTLVTIRGVSAGEALLNGAGTVAYYVDSVPFGLVKEAIGPDESVYDLQRIEVLRGPQGTLYGATALNGVVRVLTNDADLQKFEVKGRVSGSGTDGGDAGYRADMAVNVPLVTDKLAARAVVGYQDEAGWIDTATSRNVNDAHLLNLRLKVDSQPTDALFIGLSGWRSESHYGAPSIGDTPDFSSAVFPQPIRNDYSTGALKVAYQLGGFSVSSATSVLDYTSSSNLDFTPFTAGLPTELATQLGSHVFAEDVLATSTGNGPWRWSFGDTYRRASEDLAQQLPQFAITLHYMDVSKSNAVYGELTRVLFDGKLELTGGLRYFHDDISEQDQTGTNTPLVAQQSTASATTPRAVVTLHPNDRWTVYGSYSEGFRSGFPQNAPAAVVGPAEPDKLKNYELGSKAELVPNRVDLELAVYYMDWEHVQQSVTVTVDNLPFAATVNGKSASGLGVDFALTTRPADGLTVGATFSWNQLTMDDDVFSGGALLFPKGGRLNFSPQYTAGVSVDYVFPLGATGLVGGLSASGNYISEQDNRVLIGSTVAVGRGDRTLMSRASFSITAKSGWAGTLYCDNLGNYRDSPIPGYGEFPLYDGRVQPRTAGLQLEYRY